MPDTPQTAFNPAAPPDERLDAQAQLTKAHMPSASDIIPPSDVRALIQEIEAEYEQQALMKAARVIPFPGREQKPRGMQSVYLDNLQIFAFGDYFERPTPVGFDALARMVEQTPILNAVLMTRVRQVQRFCNPQAGGRGPGFTIAHVDPTHKLTPAESDSTRLLSRFLTHCGWEFNPRRRKRLKRDNLSGFMAKLVRESLTYDSAPIETEMKRDKREGIDGFYAVDGSTIRLCTDEGYRGDDEVFAVQVVQGRVLTAYTHDDLIYEPRNPRADVRTAGYGLGETELLIRVVTGFLNAMAYNSRGFDDNAIPKGILHLTGEYSQEDLTAFRRYWNAMVKGVSSAWTLPVMVSKDAESKATFERLGVDFSEMAFSRWMTFLVSIICAVYGMSPAEINFDSFTGGNTSPLSGTDTAERLAASKDSGLHPLLAYLESILSDYIISEFSEKYVFRWTGLDDEDDARRQEMRKLVLTVNEIRAEEGYDPLPGLLGDAPVNQTLIGPWLQLTQGPPPGAPTDTPSSPPETDDAEPGAPDSRPPGDPGPDNTEGPEDQEAEEQPIGDDGGAHPSDQELAEALQALGQVKVGDLAKSLGNPNHDDRGRFSSVFAPARQPGEQRGQTMAVTPIDPLLIPRLAEAAADALMQTRPVVLPNKAGPSLRLDALRYARNTARHMRERGLAIINHGSGALIELSNTGLKHAKSMTGDARAALLLYRLPSALSRSVYFKTEKPDPRKAHRLNIVAYHKFAVPVETSGQLCLAIMHIEEDDRGQFYYDAAISPEMDRLDGKPPGPGIAASAGSDRETGRHQAYFDHILKFLTVKSGLGELHTFFRKAWWPSDALAKAFSSTPRGN